MEATITLDLREQYQQLKADQPRLRIRDAAALLNTSEAQLVALGENNILLEGDFKEMLKEAHTLGYIMALTRNNDTVHERKGVYNNVSFDGPVGMALNEDIDLRLFMVHWQYSFAVMEGDRKSLQFFDKHGNAVHKIYLTGTSNNEAFDVLAAKYKAAVQKTELSTMPYPDAEQVLPDSEIDITAFRNEWLQLKDTHEFFMLLRRHKLQRTQALRLAPDGYATEMPTDTARRMLTAASEKQVPIMVFAGNKGCIQIHTGAVKKLMETGPWFNVIDPEFNLHLRETAIEKSFIVKKPSVDGIVTSLEIFDKSGEMIVQFFGKRKPGNPELQEWRDLLESL